MWQVQAQRGSQPEKLAASREPVAPVALPEWLAPRLKRKVRALAVSREAETRRAGPEPALCRGRYSTPWAF